MFPNMGCNNEAALPGRTNWAGNYTYKANRLIEPGSIEELQELVLSLPQQKALGSTHCFNDIADSPQTQISTKHLKKVLHTDVDARKVVVESGLRYGELAPQLEKNGLALHNLASLPHISIGGACATATHGSGINNGNLATAVVGIELINGSGELIKLDKNDPDFFGCVVGLGAIGMITKMTLQVEESFKVRQYVYQDLSFKEVIENFHDLMSLGYSVSLFTDWQDGKVSQLWVKRKNASNESDLGAELFGGKAATKDLHPITRLSAVHCTEQLGKEGSWYERLPHFKMGFTPSSGDELQAEYFVPFEHAEEALMAVEKIKNQVFPELLISEIRTIAADEFWMSPCYQKDSLAIHFTLKPNWPGVKSLLPQIEAELSPFGVVPHWGKLFTMEPEKLKERHPKMDQFLELVKRYDPEGRFTNDYLKKHILTS